GYPVRVDRGMCSGLATAEYGGRTTGFVNLLASEDDLHAELRSQQRPRLAAANERRSPGEAQRAIAGELPGDARADADQLQPGIRHAGDRHVISPDTRIDEQKRHNCI